MTKIEKLEKMGGKRWIKGSMNRVYMNLSVEDMWDVAAYGDGGISKTKASEYASILSMSKVYFDVATSKVVVTGQAPEWMIRKITNCIEAMLTEESTAETAPTKPTIDTLLAQHKDCDVWDLHDMGLVTWTEATDYEEGL